MKKIAKAVGLGISFADSFDTGEVISAHTRAGKSTQKTQTLSPN